MQKKSLSRALSLVLCMLLIAASACTFTGCGSKAATGDTATATQATVAFTFTAVTLDGKETTVTVNTAESTVGAALLKEGIIAGENSTYGLYVKTVNGVTLDYEKDGAYWSFYVDGAYANIGVDKTAVKAGATYMFKAEKAQ